MKSLAAVALAAGIAVWLLAIAVDSGPSTGVDRDAFTLAADLRSSAGVDVVKVFTWLGALPVMGAVLLAASAWLVPAGRRLAAGALVTGAVCAVTAVHLLKAGIDRPRPSGELVHTTLQSFPSGHATYATGFVAVAVALRSRALVVVAAAGLAVLVGLSRVYLRAHYLTDVLGGWALGAATFAGCALTAVLVGRLRHNHRRA